VKDREGKVVGSRRCARTGLRPIDREFVTSAKKKFANFNDFPKLKKFVKKSYKNSLNARVSVAFQRQLKNLNAFHGFMLIKI